MAGSYSFSHNVTLKDNANFEDRLHNFTNVVPFSGGRHEGLMKITLSAEVDMEECQNYSYVGFLRINICGNLRSQITTNIH